MATVQKILSLAALVILSMDSPSYSQGRRFDGPVANVGIPFKVQYKLARSVIVAEVVESEPKAQYNTLAKFKTLEKWRGSEDTNLSATVRLWDGCLVNSQEYKNDLAPGKKFILFVPHDFRQGAELADILPLNDDSISKTKRLLWQTDDTIGKTREEIVKQAAARGVKEAQKELTDLDNQGGRLKVYPSYSSSFYSAAPQKLRPELVDLLFEIRTADLTTQIKKQNDNPYLYQERAEWNLAAKHWDEAITDLSKTIELQKQDTEISYVPWTLGDRLSGYSRTERREPGKKLSPGAAANEANRIKYQRERRAKPLSELIAMRAKAYRNKSDFEKAVQDFTESANVYPESRISNLFERARTHYFAGNYKATIADAVETLKSKDSGYGDHARSNRVFLKACANYKQGNYQACIQDMSKLISEGYGSVDPIAWRALAERKLGQIKQFEKDVKLCSGLQGQGAVEELVLLKRDNETKALLRK